MVVGEISQLLNTLVLMFFTSDTLPLAELPVEIPEQLPEKPGPASRKLTAAGGLPKNMETFSDLLALDMSKLTVHGGCQSNETQESVQNVPPLQSLESSRWPGGSGDSRPALRTRVGIIPDSKFLLLCKLSSWLRLPRPSAGAAAEHGRLLRQPGGRDTHVRRGAAVSHLRLLPGSFSWRHQHQRRIPTPPLHPHHLKYTH